jgi:cytoskeletal protein CcmA (bactofilin family)
MGVSVAADQIVEGNFYGTSDTLTISGDVRRDAVLAAYRSVTINGAVAEDVLVAAGEARLFGSVGEDVRIVAGEVTIADTVAGDVLVIGGTLEVLSTATITGDVLFYGGTAILSGTVDGTVIGHMQSLRVDGVVAGDVQVHVDALTLGERANVTGSIRYTSPVELVRSANATVEGDITRTEPDLLTPTFSLEWFAIPLLISLFSILVWQLVSRQSLRRVMVESGVTNGWTFFVGVLVIALGIPTSVVVMVTVIGLLVGMLLLAVWLGIVAAAIIAAPAVIGYQLQRSVAVLAKLPTVWVLALGVVAFHVLRIVPLLGALLLLVLVVYTCGLITRLLFLSARSAD